jgi:hypothetical protein
VAPALPAAAAASLAQQASGVKTVDVAEGLLAKVRAADEARFGVPPPQDASPEELDRFLTARRERARAGARKHGSMMDARARTRTHARCCVRTRSHAVVRAAACCLVCRT